MFKKITLTLLAIVAVFGCQTTSNDLDTFDKVFEFTIDSNDLTGINFRNSETACTSVSLIAGQNSTAGRVDVELVKEDDVDYVYITYITESDWIIKLTHMYAGVKEGIPETKKGNPRPGVFEKRMDYEANIISDFEVEYKIPAEAFEECFYIAAHAEVFNITNSQEETAWGEGESFEGNSWAMYFEFCKSKCPITDDSGGGVEAE